MADAIAQAVIDIGVKGQQSIDRVIKSTKQLNSVLKDLAKSSVSLSELNDTRLKQEMKESSALELALQKLRAYNKAVDESVRAVVNGTAALANNEAGLVRQSNAFARVAANAKATGRDVGKFTNAVQAQEKAEQRLRLIQFKRLEAQRNLYGIGRIGDDMAFKGVPELLQFSSQVPNTIAALSAYRSELQTVFELVDRSSDEYQDLGKAIQGVTKDLENQKLKTVKPPSISSTPIGLTGKEGTLKQAKQIQEGINTLTWAHVKATVGVKQAQIAYNLELLKSKATQVVVNGEIWAMKTAWTGVVGVVKQLAGLLGGKAGKLGQAAGLIVVSKGVQDLIQKIPFLSQSLKDNIQRWATWGQRAVEGIAGVSLAYTGLSKVLSAASWTIGAISGFKKWEDEASQAIWRIDRQVKNFSDGLNAMFMMMQGKGGTLGGVAQNLKDMVLGGEERKEKIRYAGQGPTELQNLKRDLNLQETKLKQRNLNETDYIQILQKQREIKTEISQIEDSIKTKRVEAGEAASRVFKDEYNEFKNAVKEKVKADANALEKISKMETDLNAKIHERSLKRIEDRKKARLDAIEKIRKAELKSAKDAANADKRRRERRGARMGRMGESLMLGAGFPLLFGGGVGSVAGGVTGAALSMGGKGFGAQILLSALGQQVDAFMGQMAKVGQALISVEKDVTPLIERLGVAGTEFERQIQTLEKLGAEEEAFALAREKLIGIVGQQGVNDLVQFGKEAQELGNVWKQFMTQMGASLAGLVNAAGILKNLAEGITGKSRLDRGIKNEYNDAKLNDLNWMIKQYNDRSQGPYKGKTRGTGDLPSLADLQEQIKERQKILDEKRIKDEQDKVRGALETAAIKNLDKEKEKLERILKMGEKRAAIEEKINNKKADGITLSDEDYRKKLEGNEQLKEQIELWGQIKDVIASGITNAITGLIKGTQTLGEALSGIIGQIGQIIMQTAISKWVGGWSIFQKEGGYNTAGGFKAFAQGGVTTGPTLGLIGEAGEPEYVIPASKMEGAMGRYSAGARGQAVIPGGGTVASGSGVYGGSVQIDYTGPILSFNSEDYVPRSAIPEIVNGAARRGAAAGSARVFSQLKNSRSQRSKIGL